MNGGQKQIPPLRYGMTTSERGEFAVDFNSRWEA
jgi:hypothetical protein